MNLELSCIRLDILLAASVLLERGLYLRVIHCLLEELAEHDFPEGSVSDMRHSLKGWCICLITI